MNVAAYVRVSTDDQARNGVGLDAQRERIIDEAERRGWALTWFVDDGYSGAKAERPALQEALDGLKDGIYQMLVSARLDLLSRSVVHLGSLLEQAEAEGWSLVLLDFDVDTSKPTGRLVAHVLAAVAEVERQRIRERTREALAQVKAQGKRLGRPRQLPDEIVARVEANRDARMTLARIADDLIGDNVATAQGGGGSGGHPRLLVCSSRSNWIERSRNPETCRAVVRAPLGRGRPALRNLHRESATAAQRRVAPAPQMSGVAGRQAERSHSMTLR